MSNNTSNLVLIQTSQAQKELTANALALASSPATLYGRIEQNSSGLVWGFYGGNLMIRGVPTQIANGSLTLPPSTAAVYIEADQVTGAVTQNILGWTPGRIPLYQVVTGPETATGWLDYRVTRTPQKNLASLTVTGDTAFQYGESNSDIVLLTGTPTAVFSVLLAARPWVYVIRNLTSQDATFATASTVPIIVAAGKTATIGTDGTDAFRITADL